MNGGYMLEKLKLESDTLREHWMKILRVFIEKHNEQMLILTKEQDDLDNRIYRAVRIAQGNMPAINEQTGEWL